MLGRAALFNGSSFIEQLKLIVELLGTPTLDDLEEWVEDPESFVHVQESLTAESSVRAAAEQLCGPAAAAAGAYHKT